MNANRQANVGFGAVALVLLAIFALIVLPACMYKVDEAQQAIKLQFGRPVGEPVDTPGLKFKMPFIHEVRKFDKRILQWDDLPLVIPTFDREFIVVDTTARWRINDPLKFLESVKTVDVGNSRIGNAINASVRDNISRNELSEAVLSEDLVMSRELLNELEGSVSDEEKDLVIRVKTGREQITRNILKETRESVSKFGIELIDVRLKRLNYNPTVRPEVYERMISERQVIATKFRSEGKEKSTEIQGKVQKEVDIISSEAKRTSDEIRGKAEGQAAKIYNDSYGVDPEFYAFFRSMEAYGDTIGDGSTMILKSDSDFFKYLQQSVPPSSTPKK